MKIKIILTLVFLLFIVSLLFKEPYSISKDAFRPWLGIQIGELSIETKELLGLEYGVFVHYVFAAGPAARGGIKQGDIILRCNNQPVYSPVELHKMIQKFSSPQKVIFQVIRKGIPPAKPLKIKVTVEDNPYGTPQGQGGATESLLKDSFTRPRFGLKLKNLDKEFAELWGYPVKSGILVVDVYPNTPASRAGIAVGDIIISVEDEYISSYKELLAIAMPIKPGKKITLGVWHRGKKYKKELVF